MRQYTTGSGTTLAYKESVYRQFWKQRSSAELQNYSELIKLFDVFGSLRENNTTEYGRNRFEASFSAVGEPVTWASQLALGELMGNYDTWGTGTKNVYLYRKPSGHWTIIPWDYDASAGSYYDWELGSGSAYTFKSGTWSYAAPAPTTSHRYEITGTAPPSISRVFVTCNNVNFPATFDGYNSWRVGITLKAISANAIRIWGTNHLGKELSGGPDSFTLSYSGAVTVPTDKIRINEVMADNKGAVKDPTYNNSPCWIELHNTGDFAFDLSGYRLKDSGSKYFYFPEGTIVPAAGFVIVWADDYYSSTHTKDTPQPADGSLHAPFQINKSGETLTLYLPTGTTVVDTLNTGNQPENTSFGHPRNNETLWEALQWWSPGFVNPKKL